MSDSKKFVGPVTGVVSPDIEILLDALVAAHNEVDRLLATLATVDKTFMPSQSAVWPGVVARHELLKAYGRFK